MHFPEPGALSLLRRSQRAARDRPLVLDREFSYEEFDGDLIHRIRIQFVIRLNLATSNKPPRLIDADGEPVKLFYVGRVKRLSVQRLLFGSVELT